MVTDELSVGASRWREMRIFEELKEQDMPEAVIVSTARTGLAKAGRGGFNITHGSIMAGHTLKHAIDRAKVEPWQPTPWPLKRWSTT